MKAPLPYWNHNTAYYPWIRKQASDCRSVLDVGCGDGSLAFFLDDGAKEIVGIDVDGDSIRRACAMGGEGGPRFAACDFLEYAPGRHFDAVVFSASLHHMDMRQALRKAKALLAPGGKVLIVGLAKPSTAADHLLEAARVIPSKVMSAVHRMRSSEEMGLNVSYDFPPMREIRAAISAELPGARMRRGLHYRYLLVWSGR